MLQEARRIVNESQLFVFFPSTLPDSDAPGSVAKYRLTQ